MKISQKFETDRLLIKPINICDSQLIFELLNMPKWIKYIGDRNVNSVFEAEIYIQKKMLPQLQKLGFGNNTIIRKADGVKLGACGLFNREGVDGVDIGFSFLPQYEGKGYAFESAKRIIEIAKNDYQLSKINAITTKDNFRSQNLLKKLGLKFEKEISLPNDSEKLQLFVLKL